MERASVYLIERAASLTQALNFFAKGQKNISGDEKKLIFLAQIDFWDFEVESIIYCFQTFAERQKAWNSIGSIEQRLSANKLLIRPHFIKSVGDSRHRWKWRFQRRPNVVAPIEALMNLVQAWNELLERSEYLLASEKMAKSATLCGVKTLANLQGFKKVITPDLERELLEVEDPIDQGNVSAGSVT
jgi:hypothetical protein